jgi:peptidyl-prolyl cis-trans isomerase A (cyclophilin A)
MKAIATSLAFYMAICMGLSSAPSSAIAQASALPDYPQVEVETTAGNFTLELFTERAPITVENFLNYVDTGFYNGVVFHRVVAGFVVQAGGYDDEYKKKVTGPVIPNESGNGLSNRRNTIAMARTGNPHSADAQFYINLGDNLALDPRPTRWGYTVFGRVIDGMDAVDQIGYSATGPGPVPELGKDVPAEPIVITSMKIIAPAATDDMSAEPAE